MEKRHRGKRCGSLRVRGKTYWVRWQYRGQIFDRSTGITVDEKNALNRAIKKMDEMTAPYRLTSELEFQTFVSVRIKSLAQAVIDANIRGSELTLGEAYEAFKKSPRRRHVGEATLKQYQYILDAVSEKFGKGTLMNDITQKSAEGYAEEIGASCASQTFNNYIAKIGHVWDVLSTINGTQSNPWNGIVYKSSDGQAREVLTDDEIKRILVVANGIYNGEGSLLVLVGKNTGMRIGDCALLKWEDIDLEGGFIRTVTQKTGKKISVPLLNELRTQLESRTHDGEFVMPHLARRHLRASNMMARCFQKAGIVTCIKKQKDRRARPVKTFHSLRSNFITMCAEAGIELEIVQAVVGHTTRAMTEHYTHIREKAVKEAFAKAGIT